MVVGQGRIGGRRAVVQGDDFTVRGGAADAAIWQKMTVYASAWPTICACRWSASWTARVAAGA